MRFVADWLRRVARTITFSGYIDQFFFGGRTEIPLAVDGPILYLLNVSNPDRLTSDSGWIFADILTPALADLDVNVVVASPAPVTDPRIGFIQTERPRNKYYARFDFDVAATAKLIRQVRPAVIVANQVEAAPGIRAAMLEAQNDATLLAYCHYLPFALTSSRAIVTDPSLDDGGLCWPIILQFFSGIMACDRAMVHSLLSMDWLTLTAERLSIDLGDRLRVVPPPRDPRMVADLENCQPRPNEDGRPLAVYNHRLYAHYGTEKFVELATAMRDRSPVRVVVTDIFGQRRDSRTSLDSSPEQYRTRLAALPNVDVIHDGGDRQAYRTILEHATFAFAPFRQGCIWSMSIIDCQAMGVPVIAPRMAWQAEAVSDDLVFDDVDGAIEIIDRLTSDEAFWAKSRLEAQQSTEALTPEFVAAQYLRALS